MNFKEGDLVVLPFEEYTEGTFLFKDSVNSEAHVLLPSGIIWNGPMRDITLVEEENGT